MARQSPLATNKDILESNERAVLGNAYRRTLDTSFSSGIEEIIQLLTPGSQLLLRAPTGTGKSTLLPIALLKSQLAQEGKIYVVENRVEIAHQLALRVASLYSEALGKSIGLLSAEHSNISKDSKLIFVTGGVFTRIFASNPDLVGVRAVLFDEFDERTMFMDLGLGLVCDAQKRGAEFSIGLMSGTLDIANLQTTLPRANSIEFSVAKHKLEVLYSRQDFSFEQMPTEAAWLAEQIINTTEHGDILIFMPSAQTVRETATQLRNTLGDSIDVMTMYSQMAPELRAKLLIQGENRAVKIATNIAERGLTIEGVSYVIDSGLERANFYDASRDTMRLITHECPKSSVIQRQGRANRNGPGYYFALFTEDNFHFRDERNAPEVSRGPLRSALLYARTITERKSLPDVAQLFLDPPPLENLGTAQEQLVRLGALRAESPEIVTEFGLSIARLGCDPVDGARLIHACAQGSIQRMATLVAYSMNSTPFIEPATERTAALKAHQRFFKSASDDVDGLIEVFEQAASRSFSLAWCKKNYLSRSVLLQINRQRKKLLSELNSQGLVANNESSESIVLSLACASPDKVYFYEQSQANQFRNYLTLEPVKLAQRSHANGSRLILAIDQVILLDHINHIRKPTITSACSLPDDFASAQGLRNSIAVAPYSNTELHSLKKSCYPERFEALKKILPGTKLELTVLPDPLDPADRSFLGRASIEIPDFGNWSTPTMRSDSHEFLRHYLLKLLAAEANELGFALEEIAFPKCFDKQIPEGRYLRAFDRYCDRFGLPNPHFTEIESTASTQLQLTLDLGIHGQVSVVRPIEGTVNITKERCASQLWQELRTMEERGGLGQFYLAMRSSERVNQEQYESLFQELLRAHQIVGERFREIPESGPHGLVWSVEILVPIGEKTYAIRGEPNRSIPKARFAACKTGFLYLEQRLSAH